MSDYLDLDGLSIYDRKLKQYITKKHYTKAEVDNLIAEIEQGIVWKEAVATYNDIATTYPYPQEGWVVVTLDTGNMYRYNGEAWELINSNTLPIATTTQDGQMSKEMVQQLVSLGTASTKNYTATVDSSDNLPTAKAVKDNLAATVTTINTELAKKVNKDDLGDAADHDATEEIPDELDKIYVTGDYRSVYGNPIILSGKRSDNTVDLSFVEAMNDYTLGFGLVNYSTEVIPKLHITGSGVNSYFTEGETITSLDIPADYTATLEYEVRDYDPDNEETIHFLTFPSVINGVSHEYIDLVDKEDYVLPTVVFSEVVDEENYTCVGEYGLYSSDDIPTSTAVTILVRSVANALGIELNDRIDGVEDKIDAFEETPEEEIDSWFDF